MTFIDTAFINTEVPPTNARVICYYVTKTSSMEPELEVYAVMEYQYPHPEAPNEAMLTVMRTDFVTRLKSHEEGYAQAFMLAQAGKVVKDYYRA